MEKLSVDDTIYIIKMLPVFFTTSLIFAGPAAAQIIYSCVDSTLHPYMLFVYANLFSFTVPIGLTIGYICLLVIGLILEYLLRKLVKGIFELIKYCVANYLCCANFAMCCIELDKNDAKEKNINANP